MSIITSPAIFKRLSCRLPARVNSINPSSSSSSTISSSSSSSANSTAINSNSTCPLPPSKKQVKSKSNQFKVSHDITMLYELFSTLSPGKLPCATASPMPVCLCCERKITSQVCLPNQRQHETAHNKQTSALFYGSQSVKKYMKNIMTKTNLNDIISHGFPCPHTALKSAKNKIQYYCEQCEHDKRQDTIRLTLTPSHCRSQDNEIYNNNASTLTPKQKTLKKRRGCIFFM
ncbi:hypothetical protein BD408DRAFT_435935 [Parasitella parasitica]|nr:hypothetical protein BD408DRAFT_435935 [Parasitella parasitica]